MKRLKRILALYATAVVIIVGAIGFGAIGLVATILGAVCAIAQRLCEHAFGHSVEGLAQLHDMGVRANSRARPQRPSDQPDDRARKAGLP